MIQVPYEISCMTDHPSLEPVCLNIYSLQNALNVYRTDHGRLRLRGWQGKANLTQLLHVVQVEIGSVISILHYVFSALHSHTV